MSDKNLEVAKEQLKEATEKGNYPEIARIIGAPIDPRKPYPKVVEAICDTEPPASPEEYLFYFDVDEDVKEVYTLSNTATVTVQKITPTAPNAVVFAGVQSKAYRVHISDLLSAKFDVIGKKKNAVVRSLDAKEIKKVLDVGLAGVPGANQFSLASGVTRFTYDKLVDMIEAVADYGEDYVLVMGSNIWRDIITWDYDENKYHSIKAMTDDLDVEMIKVTGTLKEDGGSETAILDANKALLVARNTVVGKPFSFGRKLIASAKVLGEETDEPKQRKIAVLPAVIANGEEPSVTVWGFEEIACVLKNSKAIASFERA